jgi:hypothetical protein
LFDADFASRAWTVRNELPASSEPPALPPSAAPTASAAPSPAPTAAPADSNSSALQLLALLQREGRFVDFLMQDVSGFPDADVGTAARVVHEGCRKALRSHMKISALREEEEESTVTVEAGFDPASVKLSGKVAGTPPFTGKLVHKGWRAGEVRLPTAVKGHDPNVLAPAEVEL